MDMSLDLQEILGTDSGKNAFYKADGNIVY
jgi:hypothetical protein